MRGTQRRATPSKARLLSEGWPLLAADGELS